VRYDGVYRIVKCWRVKGKQVGRSQSPVRHLVPADLGNRQLRSF
jgi:hypothetical protein